MDVRGRDEAVGAHDGFHLDGFAAGLARRLAEDEHFSGDGVLEPVSLADHAWSFPLAVWRSL
jgi:hypothetical protein